MNSNQLKFLSELEEDILQDDVQNNENMKSIFKSKYDMHSSKNVISNSMHESLGNKTVKSFANPFKSYIKYNKYVSAYRGE